MPGEAEDKSIFILIISYIKNKKSYRFGGSWSNTTPGRPRLP
ncbi:hypothetical protein ENTCAN_06447 [Enterobacter cancerogenus ATCC 35316]|nr:hypothetical protein ENTCAN_06447 [Enterobacter cancerogenus ATCC 35316]